MKQPRIADDTRKQNIKVTNTKMYIGEENIAGFLIPS